MTTLFYGHVMNGNHRVHYYRTGGLKPPVIFLHGLSDSGLCWSRIALALEPDYDTIMVDLRGHGLSGAGDDSAIYDATCDDIAELVRSLDLGKVIMIGHSIGANITTLFANKYSDMLMGLVLEDPAWVRLVDQIPGLGTADNLDYWLMEYRKWKAMTFLELKFEAQNKYPFWEEDDHFQWAKAKQQLRQQFINYIGGQTIDWSRKIGDIRKPALILAGAIENGSLVSTQAREIIKRDWKSARLLELSGTGHNIRRDDPYQFTQEVKKFLRGFPIKNGGYR